MGKPGKIWAKLGKPRKSQGMPEKAKIARKQGKSLKKLDKPRES